MSKATFNYLDSYAWWRIARWLRHRHKYPNWKSLRRRFYTGTSQWRPTQHGITLFNPVSIEIIRYRWRGHHIPTPWQHIRIDPA